MTETIIRADRLISEIRMKLDYQRYMTPRNFHEENERFLIAYQAGEIYNPQYGYESLSKEVVEELEGLLEELQAISLGHDGMSQLLEKERTTVAYEVKMYQAIGTPAFTKLAKQVFGSPDPALYEKALKAAAPGEAAPDRQKTLTADQLKEALAKRVKEYGFDWHIEVRQNMTSKVSVEPERREVLINGKKTFSENDLVRLCAHEVDTHVLRTENGAKRDLGLFVSGTAGSLIHEEGLALYNEAKQKVMDLEMLRLYAGRFISCLFLEESSFYESFDRLVKMNFSLDQAMYIVARVKRGIADTGLGGGFVKDYVYFQGYYEVANAIEKQPDLYEQMYYGGISLENLDILQDEIQRERKQGRVTVPRAD